MKTITALCDKKNNSTINVFVVPLM